MGALFLDFKLFFLWRGGEWSCPKISNFILHFHVEYLFDVCKSNMYVELNYILTENICVTSCHGSLVCCGWANWIQINEILLCNKVVFMKRIT